MVQYTRIRTRMNVSYDSLDLVKGTNHKEEGGKSDGGNTFSQRSQSTYIC